MSSDEADQAGQYGVLYCLAERPQSPHKVPGGKKAHARKYVDEEEVYHGTWKERGTKLPETLILEAALEQQRQQKILHRHPGQN